MGIIRAGGSCMKRMTIKTVNNNNNNNNNNNYYYYYYYYNTTHFNKNVINV